MLAVLLRADRGVKHQRYWRVYKDKTYNSLIWLSLTSMLHADEQDMIKLNTRADLQSQGHRPIVWALLTGRRVLYILTGTRSPSSAQYVSYATPDKSYRSRPGRGVVLRNMWCNTRSYKEPAQTGRPASVGDTLDINFLFLWYCDTMEGRKWSRDLLTEDSMWPPLSISVWCDFTQRDSGGSSSWTASPLFRWAKHIEDINLL